MGCPDSPDSRRTQTYHTRRRNSEVRMPCFLIYRKHYTDGPKNWNSKFGFHSSC